MSGTRLPAVRIPAGLSSQVDDNTNSTGQEPILMDLPPSNKFAISWPVEGSTPVTLPLMADRPPTLSSSEGETDISEDELSIPPRRSSRSEELDEAEFITPTNHLNLDSNPMDQQGQPGMSLPRLSRAFSMPLPSQLGSLQNPRRLSSVSHPQSPPVEEQSSELAGFHELSLELADSVQMVIQTLLQLSPPQVLDPAKEQFSACSLAIPTPSISAMFTSMKNLNYMSANMSALSIDPSFSSAKDPPCGFVSSNVVDFDVGEMLQSVGDAMSGMAAQAGVDLVLFHGDVGMKHVAVNGDESGISYTLSHILRQVVGTSYRGDTVELGLFVEPVDDEPPEDPLEPTSLPSPSNWGSQLRCTFYVAHRFASPEVSPTDGVPLRRAVPSLNSFILKKLLRHIGASLEADMKPRGSFVGRSCEVTIVLNPGSPSVVNPTVQLTPEEAACIGSLECSVSPEPTLEQLTQFAESLRGKKATLHASPEGSFAHHLSSYLTAWGMDVGHFSTEPDADERAEGGVDPLAHLASSNETPNPPSQLDANLRGSATSTDPPKFILIDDDVSVLRNRIQKLLSEPPYPLHLHPKKRPPLATNHRPRSSPQVVRVMGMTANTTQSFSQVVIVHFTSLSNFKLVKDAIQSSLVPTSGASGRVPEVIVIPKPAGPRRFLTALHTAVTKPVVDSLFAPIATSPISPSFHGISPFFTPTNAPKSPSGRSTASFRTSSDRSNRSPKEHLGEFVSHGSSSPLGADEMEYFSDAAVKLGASPSTGLVIQSPNGQPAGIFFHPKPKSSFEKDGPSFGVRGRGASFRLPPTIEDTSLQRGEPSTSRASVAPFSSLRPAPPIHHTSEVTGKARQVKEDYTPKADLTPSPVFEPVVTSRMGPSRRLSQATSSPPLSPPSKPSQPTATSPLRTSRRSDAENPMKSKKRKGPGEGNIVPPISVLIVDDNPINQTILSTFMKKKKIKYDVAKNGEEAVQKWRSGLYHLILMDIQMPVMNGIQATKEIRRIEKQNGSVGFPSTPQSEGQQTPSEGSTTDSRSSSTPPYRSSVIIVALTASSLQADRVAALGAGCNDFLTKPVNLQWLNNKIIEWGSIKALQMWADIRPEVAKNFSSEQAAQARNVARKLHVPEGRSTPTSRSASAVRSLSAPSSEPKSSPQEKDVLSTIVLPETPLTDSALRGQLLPKKSRPSNPSGFSDSALLSLTESTSALTGPLGNELPPDGSHSPSPDTASHISPSPKVDSGTPDPDQTPRESTDKPPSPLVPQ